MSLGLIAPMQFDIVKAYMASLLASERDAQIGILEAAMTTPDTITVSGAGTAGANGAYTRSGATWVKGSYTIVSSVTTGNCGLSTWKLTYTTTSTVILYTNPSAATLPPKTGWVVSAGLSTAPTLAYTSVRLYTDEYIDNNFYFNVFKDLYRLPDASELPAINIRNHSGKFGAGAGKNYLSDKWHSYVVSIECYSISTAEGDSVSNTRSDQLSAARLDYLFSQAWNTFEAEANFYKNSALQSIVRKSGFQHWEQHKYPVTGSGTDTAETILAIHGIYELQFAEPTAMVQGVPFEEIVASLEIDEEFISPFVTVRK